MLSPLWELTLASILFHPAVLCLTQAGPSFYSYEHRPHSIRVQALWVELPHVQMFSSCLGITLFPRLKTPHLLCRCLLVFEASLVFLYCILFYITFKEQKVMFWFLFIRYSNQVRILNVSVSLKTINSLGKNTLIGHSYGLQFGIGMCVSFQYREQHMMSVSSANTIVKYQISKRLDHQMWTVHEISFYTKW